MLPPHYSIRILGSLHNVEGKFANLARSGRLKNWWWTSSDRDFVTTIFTALETRHELARAGGADMSILDRGVCMFEAVSIATIAVKNDFANLEDARQLFQGVLATTGLRVQQESVTILLKFNITIGEAVERTLEREPDHVDDRYRKYQSLLHAQIAHQVASGRYQHIVEAEGTRLEVQNRIRELLFSITAGPLRQTLTPLLSTLDRVYMFGGLSESGKSTLANALQSSKAPGTASRLKIGYLCDRASARLGQNVYDLPDKDQALHVVHELHAFASSHYWLKSVTLESAHRKEATQWMKVFLGDKLRVLYMEVTLAKRQMRSLVSLADLSENDRTKCNRGADEIKHIADVVLDNNGPLEATLRQLSLV